MVEHPPHVVVDRGDASQVVLDVSLIAPRDLFFLGEALRDGCLELGLAEVEHVHLRRRGYQGYYDHGLGTVDVCNNGDAGDPRRTLLHELGHAWAFTHLTDDQVAAWTTHRGLTAWTSDTLPWWQMSKEHAAEIIAWGLQDDDEYQSIWLHLEECEDLAATFELLTRTPPLHTNTHYCK